MSKACVSVLEMGAARRHQNYSCASEITVGVEGRLVVDDLLLEVGLRVLADRANLRGLLAHVQVTAVEALPDLDAREPPHSAHNSAHSFELNSVIPVTFQPVNFIARR